MIWWDAQPLHKHRRTGFWQPVKWLIHVVDPARSNRDNGAVRRVVWKQRIPALACSLFVCVCVCVCVFTSFFSLYLSLSLSVSLSLILFCWTPYRHSSHVFALFTVKCLITSSCLHWSILSEYKLVLIHKKRSLKCDWMHMNVDVY